MNRRTRNDEAPLAGKYIELPKASQLNTLYVENEACVLHTLLRLDGDLYESTMTALVPLFDKVSKGGFVIVDDYGSCPPYKQAVDDFWAQIGIVDALQVIDRQSVYWRKS